MKDINIALIWNHEFLSLVHDIKLMAFHDIELEPSAVCLCGCVLTSRNGYVFWHVSFFYIFIVHQYNITWNNIHFILAFVSSILATCQFILRCNKLWNHIIHELLCKMFTLRTNMTYCVWYWNATMPEIIAGVEYNSKSYFFLIRSKKTNIPNLFFIVYAIVILVSNAVWNLLISYFFLMCVEWNKAKHTNIKAKAQNACKKFEKTVRRACLTRMK